MLKGSSGLSGVLLGAALGVLVFAAAQGAGLRLARVSSGSMTPAVRVGDWVLLDRPAGPAGAWARRGDIVLFAYPFGSDLRAIKRVAGVPGDRMVAAERRITVNGHATSLAGGPPNLAGRTQALTVPHGRLYLMGDNAAASVDSRWFGPVPEREVLGRVRVRIAGAALWTGLALAAALAGLALGLGARRRAPLGA